MSEKFYRVVKDLFFTDILLGERSFKKYKFYDCEKIYCFLGGYSEFYVEIHHDGYYVGALNYSEHYKKFMISENEVCSFLKKRYLS